MSQGQRATRSTDKAAEASPIDEPLPPSPSPTEPNRESPTAAAEAQKAVTRTRKSMAYSEPKATNALKLDDHNYVQWAVQVQAFLVARGYWRIVSGRYKKPVKKFINGKDGEETEESLEEGEDWFEMDRKAWYKIKAFCSPSDAVFYKPETAKEFWDRLEETKRPMGTTFYLSQIRAFINYKQGPNESAEHALNALRKIQADIQIITPETPIHDNLLREIFLGSLREDPYGPIVFRIRNESVESSIPNTLRLLKEKEMEQAINKSIKNATANNR